MYKKDSDLKKNASGCKDLTAYEGIKNADKALEKERYKKLIGAILRVCEPAGFTVESKIVLKDNRTGKVWK